MEPRLKEIIIKKINPGLKEKFGYKNLYMGPKIQKIVLNMGLGLDGNDSKILKTCEEDLSKITGQKPVTTKFKKSISNFKTRKDTKAGLKVTLRKDKMYEFIDRLVNIALPRIKDFRGLSAKGFDKFGNYTFGVKEKVKIFGGAIVMAVVMQWLFMGIMRLNDPSGVLVDLRPYTNLISGE